MRYGLPAVILIGAAMLGGCTQGVLDPKGPIAAADRQILLNSLGIMLAIVIPVIVATLGVAFWFVHRMSARTIGRISRIPVASRCLSGRSRP
jgi:heme/copper-type cytochrome/quinol oxidase subunit 2